MAVAIEDAGFEIRDQIGWLYGSGFPKSHNGAWGGTALKPAWEPVCMARKPLQGTVEANWRKHGTGALNIDGCRVLVEGEDRAPITGRGAIPARQCVDTPREPAPVAQPHELGRWPANVIHDGSSEVVAAFPQAQGQQGRARTDGAEQGNNTFGALRHVTKAPEPRADTGSAARFFYCAKADRADRNEGGANNVHPTVKPTELMRYLCRLVTPPGGVVLDPFMGSGSTLKAAELEGFSGIGIELSADYIAIAKRRIAGDVKKCLQSAIANAENNHSLDVDSLIVAEAWCGKNLVMKRGRPRARGRFGKIMKPFSEITILVRQVGESA